MGRVYDAVQVELGRRCALKVLIPELAKSPNILERFRREALAAAVLGHPHIVDVTDFVLPEGGPPFLVMERLLGEALVDVLTRDGMLEVPRSVRLTVQLLDALQAAHEAGIVHRDLKPANVFLVSLAGGDEMVKLLDFGVAKLRDGPSNRKLTAIGEMIGTPRFAAPEQLKGETVDARTDVYGAGVLLYGMLTGKPPFTGPNADLIRAVLSDDPIDPRVVNPAVDPGLAAVVAKAMSKSPADRYPSAQAMIDALGGRRAKGALEADGARPSVAHVASQKHSQKPPGPSGGSSRGPLLIMAAAMFVFSLLIATATGFAGYHFGGASADELDDAPPPATAADVATQTASCEEYVETSCACPGEHRSEICDRARTSVISLRRSVQIGATAVTTAGEWCQGMLDGQDLCAADDAASGSIGLEAVGAGTHSGALTEGDETRSDGAFTDRVTVQLTAGQRVDIWVMSEAFDPYLVLRNANGRLLAVNDDTGSMPGETNAQIVYYPRVTGTFILEAGSARPDQLGAYELVVNFGEASPTRIRRPSPRRRREAEPALPEPWQQAPPPTRDERGQAPREERQWERDRRGRAGDRERNGSRRW